MSTGDSDISPPNGSLCPHWAQVDQELFEDLFSEVAKVRADRPELFRFTHRKISVFERFTEADTDPERTETELLDAFTTDRQRNLVTIIDGNVGTGKSELCAYLSLELQEAGRNVLHIDKNADLLTIMAEEIPRFYEQVTGGETLDASADLDRLRERVSKFRGLVADQITASAIFALPGIDEGEIELDETEQEQIKEFIQAKLVNLVQRGEYATKIEFVTVDEDANEIDDHQCLDVFDDVSDEVAAARWNEAIWEAIRAEYDTPTMDQLLAQVADWMDERPVLVFEDFSVSALDAERLQQYIEDDAPSDAWDFIIAGTQDSIRTLETETAKDRSWIRFFRTTQPNSSNVKFLTEDTATDFIRPFLAFLKHRDGSIAYRRDNDNHVDGIESPAPGSICAACEFCDDAFRDLFPFNQTFLERIYRGLSADEQRPRIYVQTVAEILSRYYHEDTRVPANVNSVRELSNPIVLEDDVYDNEPLRLLIQWYGEESTRDDQNVLELDERFARAFGLGREEYEDYGIVVDERDDSTVLVCPVSEGELPSKTTEKNRGEEPDPIAERYKKAKGYIDAWQSDTQASAASSVDVYIKRGLTDAIEKLSDGFEIFPGGELEYLVGSEREPFAFADAGPADEDQIVIRPSDFTQADLLTLLRYGIARDVDPSRANGTTLIDELGPQLVGYTQRWQSHIQTQYLSPEYLYSSANQDRTFEQFVVGAYGALAILEDPAAEVTGARLAQLYTADEPPTLNKAFAEVLRDLGDRESYEAIVGLFEVAEEIEELFGDVFALSDSIVDVPRVETVRADGHPFEIGQSLTKSSLRKLPADVRFDTQTTLKQVGLSYYEMSRVLSNLPAEDEAVAAPNFVRDQLGGINMEHIEEVITKISTYESSVPGVNENLKQFVKYPESEITNILDAYKTFRKLNQDRDESTNIQAHILGLTIMGNDVTTLLLETDFPGVSGGDGSEAFNEVAEYYVD